MYKKVIEKAVNIKVKTSLQPPSEIKKIDFKCLKGYKPAKNKKTKPIRITKIEIKISPISTNNTSSFQVSKKDKYHQKNCWEVHPVMMVNTIEITKKNENKAKNLSHIKCYIYK